MKFEVIKQVTIIEAGPAEVYEAYADPKKHAAFTGDAATGTAKVGESSPRGAATSPGNTLSWKRGRGFCTNGQQPNGPRVIPRHWWN